MDRNELVANRLNDAHPGVIEEIVDFRGERTLIVAADNLIKVCQFLRDDADLRYNFLADICGDDMLPDFPRFYVNYHLHSLPNGHRVRVRVPLEDPDDGPPTLAPLWKVSSWLEMEVYDLMGIRFKDHGGLRRLFLPEDWQGYPLRKDYPLGYEEVQFSFNWEQIDSKKPYAKE